MSPVLAKEESKPVSRVPSAFSEDTVTRYSLDEGLYHPQANDPEAHIRSWSTREVVDWMLEIGCDASVIECFEHHDINGTVLVDLDFDDLKELDIQSFGKRHALWNAICLLRGEDGIPSPQPTPFQDISRPCTSNSRKSPSHEWHVEPITPSDKKRRGRKEPRTQDVITPEQSVSIVAIEQLLPKPHKCAKGERCAKWRKQQRELQQLHDEHGIGRFPVSPTNGGRIFVAGDPGNATTADNMRPFEEAQLMEDPFRPNSEAKLSVIASSGLLTPGQLPQFALQEDTLNQLGSRDPQDNVMRFLHYQHMSSPTQSPTSDSPTTETAPPLMSPPLEMFPSKSVSPFPAQYHEAPAVLSQQLRTLPKLDIPGPRSASAGPQLHHRSSPLRQQPQRQQTAPSTLSHQHNYNSAPSIYRHGTPNSEIDVPDLLTTPTAAILDRDTSQSVPPNMQFRPQNHATPSRSNSAARDWRRPSMHTALPAVREHEVLQVRDPAHHSPVAKNFGYGPECTHSGWMRKRKTKLLRHEWNDAHFRLKGTQLGMHGDAKLETKARETIDVDGYAVACSSVTSQGKLRAGLKAFALKSPEKAKEGTEMAAFSFQLVPQIRAEGKTHHFAVKNKDERIDWMRELMLAKALKQKKEGYEVEVNGVQVE